MHADSLPSVLSADPAARRTAPADDPARPDTAGAATPELIVPRWIVPVEPASVVLEDHALVVHEGRIAALGPAAELADAWPDARRTDLPWHVVTPGFTNLHTHAPMALLRGVGDDMPLDTWLRERIWPLESQLMSEEFAFDGSVLACAEMLRSGVTCFNDMYFHPEGTVRAAQAFGMRVAVSVVVLDFPTPWAAGPDEYLRKGLALRDRLRGERRVHFTLGPHAPYTVSDGPLREIAQLAAELSLPIHIHVHETAAEVAEGVAKHGVRPIARLASLGVLGPETIAVHAVHLDDGDIRLLAEHGATVAHCPHSNLKLASGIAPVARLSAAGVRVGIGTDGSASNNRLDLLAEARTAALLAKGTSGDAAAWPAHATLRAMTLDGARALGLEGETGSLQPGKCADIVAFDLDDPALSPVFDPVSHLIYAAGSEHMTHAWLAGRPVVRKRQLADPATAQLLAEVTARSRVWQNRIARIVPIRP